MRGEKCDVVGDCAFDSLRLDGEIGKTPPAKLCAFPCNGGNIRRGRQQLFRNRLAARIDQRKSVFFSGGRERTAISHSPVLSTFERTMPIQACLPIPRYAPGPVPSLITRLPQAAIFAGCG